MYPYPQTSCSTFFLADRYGFVRNLVFRVLNKHLLSFCRGVKEVRICFEELESKMTLVFLYARLKLGLIFHSLTRVRNDVVGTRYRVY